jgi:cytochrome P450 family 135
MAMYLPGRLQNSHRNGGHVCLIFVADARTADLWEDPLVFRPERFLDASAGMYAWIPFGGGRRRCLGAAFALVEARIVLRTILRTARLAPSSRRPERIGRNNVILAPAHGGSVRLDRRTPACGLTDHCPQPAGS